MIENYCCVIMVEMTKRALCGHSMLLIFFAVVYIRAFPLFAVCDESFVLSYLVGFTSPFQSFPCSFLEVVLYLSSL